MKKTLAFILLLVSLFICVQAQAESTPATISFPVKAEVSVPEGVQYDGKWSYSISVTASEGAPVAANMSGTVDKNNPTVTFGDFTFTEPGTYTYTVTETNTVAGVKSDSAKTVTITVDEIDGSLTATASSTDETPVTFTNEYAPTPVQLSFPVKAEVSVPEGVQYDGEWSYSISVTANDGAPYGSTMNVTVHRYYNNPMNVGPFTFTMPGTYTYTVTETSAVTGVINDSDKTVTITVVDNGDGVLRATASSTSNNPVTFTNKMSVVTVSIPVKVVVSMPDGTSYSGDWSGGINIDALNGAPSVNNYVGISKNNSTFTLGPINFTAPGTYTYALREDIYADKITEDANKTVTITVAANEDGSLSATLSTDEVIFNNKYTPNPTTDSFYVRKVMSVPAGLPAPDSWSYNINVETQNGAPSAETMTGTVSNAADTVTFGPITFTAPGTYTYKVTESGTVTDVDNDSEAENGKIVTIVVVDEYGTLKVQSNSAKSDNPLTFTNNYAPEYASVTFPVKKVMTAANGHTVPSEWSYSINVEAQDGAPSAAAMTGTVSNKADTVTFGPFNFLQEGTYTYTVTESGYVTDVDNDPEATRTVTISVVKNPDGTLTATASHNDGNPVTFTNTYNPIPKFAISPFNNHTNNSGNRPELYNDLTLTGGSSSERIILPVPEAGGSITLPCDASLGGFTISGQSFSITESADASDVYPLKLIGWYNISTGKYYSVMGGDVTVPAEEIGENNVFYADWIAESYNYTVSNSNTISTIDTSAFATINVFDYSDLVNVHGLTLTQNGLEGEHWQVDSEGGTHLIFSDWGTYYGGTNPSGNLGFPDGRDGTIGGYDGENIKEEIITSTNSHITKDLFDTSSVPGTAGYAPGINYLGSGNYLFDYDPETHMYSYKSQANGAVYNQEDQRFYVLDGPTNYYGGATEMNRNNFFPFNSTDDTLNKTNGVPNFWFGMSATIDFWLPDNSGEDSGNKIQGSPMIFDFSGDDDMWVFVDGKLVLDLGGIHDPVSGTIDFATGNVIVKGEVVKNIGFEAGEHQLQIYYLERGGDRSNCNISFALLPRLTNALQVQKTLTGRDLQEGEFTFGLYHENGDSVVDVEGNPITGTNTADGTVIFSAMGYTQNDLPGDADTKDFTYIIREIEGDKTDIIYDDSWFTATVTLNLDDNGMLSATTVYQKDGANVNAAVFENEYVEEPVGNLKLTKLVEGKVETAAFTFNITFTQNDQPYTEPVVCLIGENEQTLQGTEGVYQVNLSHGQTASFINLPVGLKYVITEQDKAPYTATVTTGNAEGTIVLGDTEVIFTNTYTLTPITASFPVKKVVSVPEGLTGPAEWSYEITVTANGGAPVAKTMTGTVTNAADTVTFGDFTYTAPGTYTYTVTETGTVAGVTNDSAATTGKTVTVTVVDNKDGTLTATASSTADAPLTFTNNYDAESVSTIIKATKTLEGRAYRPGDEFRFELVEDGIVVQRVRVTPTSGQQVEFEFGQITYAVPGEHTYLIREEKGTIGGMTYDTTEYTAKVTVTEVDGQLTANTAYFLNDEEVAEAAFVNTYEAAGELTLTADKTVNGKEPTAEQAFSFTLSDENGEIETVQNVLGEINFSKLTYTLADIGTHTYTITEHPSEIDNCQTDATVYTVTVTVSDTGNGTLNVKSVIAADDQPADAILFENKIFVPLTISKTVVGCETDETFPISVWFFNADGMESTGTFAYTGDVSGEITSGQAIELAHGQKVTIEGLIPGMRYIIQENIDVRFTTTVNTLPISRVEGVMTEGGNIAAFVNKLVTTEFKVTKEWRGGEGGKIRLTLYANGVALEPQPEYEVTGNTYKYTQLPKYDEDGDEIIYTAKEKYMDGYLTIYDNVKPFESVTNVIHNGGTIINKAIVDFKVQKVWSGLAEGAEKPAITLTLYCNGEVYEYETPKPDKNGWYHYDNLPAYVNGVRAEYSVVEEPIEGCFTTYTNDGEPGDCAYNGGVITNYLVPQTGDETPIAIWTALMMLSAAAVLLLFRKQKA